MKKVTNINEFIEKARKIHGDKYDYSKVNYINSSTKVCIICPIHGEFWQKPNDHLPGKGCKYCGIESRTQKKTLSNKTFIERACEIHNNFYSYEETNYVNAKTEIKICCPEHGYFYQLPYVHLNGFGCAKCSNRYHYTNNEFIEKAKKVHDNKYDYSKTEYINSHTKICVICPEHGEFWQTASDHLQGKGCAKCSKKVSKGEIEINQIYCYCDVLEEEARVHITYDLMAPFSKNMEVEVIGKCGESEFYARKTMEFKAGAITSTVKNAKLWWPYGYGDANLYDVTANFYKDGELVATKSFKTGIRTVDLVRTDTTDGKDGGCFKFIINGEEIMVKGTNWVPMDVFHSRDKDRYDKALELIKHKANLQIEEFNFIVFDAIHPVIAGYNPRLLARFLWRGRQARCDWQTAFFRGCAGCVALPGKRK